MRVLHISTDLDRARDPAKVVHDVRVASRRLRALAGVLEAFAGQGEHAGKPFAGLKRVTRAVGELRDLDVLLAHVEQRLARAESDVERAALEHVLERLFPERERALHRASKCLRKLGDRHLSRSKAAFDAALEDIPHTHSERARRASELLEARVAAAERAAAACAKRPSEQALHTLRIACKKLRYMLEAFEPLLGARYAALHARATALQELLGEHHDLAVLDARLEALRGELLARKRRVLASQLQRVRAQLTAEQAAHVERYRAAPFDAATFRDALQAALR